MQTLQYRLQNLLIANKCSVATNAINHVFYLHIIAGWTALGQLNICTSYTLRILSLSKSTEHRTLLRKFRDPGKSVIVDSK